MTDAGFITIHLHGHLKQHLAEPLRVKARTLRQALTALQTVDVFNPRKTQRKVPARIDHFSTPAQLDEAWGREEVHLRPEPGFAGASFGDVLRVIVGVVLLVVALILAGPTGGGSLVAYTAAVAASVAGNYFLMTGLQGLMYGKPTSEAAQEQKRSYFGNYQQTTQSGTAIPIILGVHQWAGHLISFGMDVKPGTEHKVPDMSDLGGWDYYDDTNATTLPAQLTWQQVSDAFTA